MNIDKPRIAKEVLEFLQTLCDLEFPTLETKWGIPHVVVDEIKEDLERFSDDGTAVGFAPPPLGENDIQVVDEDSNDNAPLRLYRLNSGDGLAVECDLWFKGKLCELTALMDIYERDGGRREIDFRLLEVM